MEWLITLATVWLAIQLAGVAFVGVLIILGVVFVVRDGVKRRKRAMTEAAWKQRYGTNPPYTC